MAIMTLRIRALFLVMLAATALFAAAPAVADALDDALQSGVVGETPRGYIAPVGAPSAATMQLVNDINARRREKYAAIARDNGLTLQQVETLAGKRIIERAPAGIYYQDPGGAWRRK